MSTDLQGRPWLTVEEAKAGMYVDHDSGSDCWHKGRGYRILDEEYGGLYIRCKVGSHWLEGQLSDDGKHYVGLYRRRKS